MRLRIYRGLRILNDADYHQGRDFSRFHLHVHDPLRDIDPDCKLCRQQWKCRGCGALFALHEVYPGVVGGCPEADVQPR